MGDRGRTFGCIVSYAEDDLKFKDNGKYVNKRMLLNSTVPLLVFSSHVLQMPLIYLHMALYVDLNRS